MATPSNLSGLGMPSLLAARVGMHVQAVTCGGTTAGAATQIPGKQGIYYVNASNSGSGVALPLIGGQGPTKGALLGDSYTVANIIGATIYVYANANAAGSAITFYGDGASTAGTTGLSVQTGFSGIFQPITVSTWIFMRAPASA
jgi:hypothetical protein